MFATLIHIGAGIGLAAVAAAVAPPAGDKPAAKSAVTDKPLTVKIEPSAPLRAKLSAAAKADPKVSVRLVLDGVVPPAGQNQLEGIRVFLNEGDATRTTPAEGPHYVTAFTFAPTAKRDPQGFNLDLTRSVAELSRQGKLDPTKPLVITLVAVPVEGVKQFPEDFSVPVGKVSVVADVTGK